MRLESVRQLKQELFEGVRDAAPMTGHSLEGVESTLSASPRRRGSASRAAQLTALKSLALGVSRRGPNQFVLAIRQQQGGPQVQAATELIRNRAKGEVDVRFVGQVVKRALSVTSAQYYRSRRRPLRIGSSISDVPAEVIVAGTLGCFVIGKKRPYYVSLLTNNHVIAGENANSQGDPIVQQGTLDGGSLPTSQIGWLGRFIRLRKTGLNGVDAALGNLSDEIEINPTSVGNRGALQGLGSAADLPPRAYVYKVGRTTGQTRGRITAIEVDQVWVPYNNALGTIRFDGQIEIEGTGQRPFSDSGDSGSLIVDGANLGIGLLFAGSERGGSNGKGLTYANGLSDALDALDVELHL